MPSPNEGHSLYTPITPPGISVTEAGKNLQLQDKILRTFPEAETVLGKIGKAETSTDPAPMSMVETTIVLNPEREWRRRTVDRWDSQQVPGALQPGFRWRWPAVPRL